MRDIKFRAWDKRWKRWIDPEDVEIYGSGTIYAERRAEPDGDVIEMVEASELEVVLYTCLKDKNDREIYEGDIVKIHESGWHDIPEGLLLRVHWCTSGFGWCGVDEDPSGHHICSGWTSGSDMEVVGNIYENPDML